MPLLLQEDLCPPGEWGVWSITEPETELRGRLAMAPAEAEQLSAIRGAGRRREFLAARLLLHTLSGRAERGALVKDEFGKPHLAGSPFQVSISHTHGFSAAIAHPRPCGVDIQTYVPRIRRLARKFVGPREATWLDPGDELRQLHLLWSAKEALYKAYGRRQLDFRAHLEVDPRPAAIGEEWTRGWLRKDGQERAFRVRVVLGEEYVLVGGVEFGV